MKFPGFSTTGEIILTQLVSINSARRESSFGIVIATPVESFPLFYIASEIIRDGSECDVRRTSRSGILLAIVGHSKNSTKT